MLALKYILISSCLLLSACQTTSIRELSTSESNTAKAQHIEAAQSTGKDYPATQENHLRMYVFTAYQTLDNKETERNGYFIDFKAAAPATNK